MNTTIQRLSTSFVALLLTGLLVACGAPASAQNEEATPTPLPPAPEIERPTYTVQRGVIEDPLEVTGRVSPVDLSQLAFRRTGTVEKVDVDRGQKVTAGQLLAELSQNDELNDLRDAEDGLVQAERDLQSAQKQQQSKIEQAKLDLQEAIDNMNRLLPGGADDPIRKAQDAVEEARREAEKTGVSGSEGKTQAEYELLKATEALSDTQKEVSDAYWQNDWAQKYGTDPKQPFIEETDADGKIIRKPKYLTEEEKVAYQKSYVDAQRRLREAERLLVQAQRTVEQKQKDEITGNGEANKKLAEAERVLNDLLSGKGNKDLIAAQKTVKQMQLALEEAQAETFNTAIKAVETAKRTLEKAQKKVDDGRIIAPKDGEVISLSISAGDTAEVNQFVIEIADTSKLEVGTELSNEQMRRLQEGQPAEITLLSRPDVIMPAIIRQMPAPHGSGGSGSVESKDRRTLFEIGDFKGQELKSGQNVKIRIVLERKDDALWLPPDAVRSFEGRRFVLVRTDKGEERRTVRIGIETEDKIEILEGVKEGDVIVGQ
jgi:RND family efflux transporter MFP subunit